jgi:hypothetical protein
MLLLKLAIENFGFIKHISLDRENQRSTLYTIKTGLFEPYNGANSFNKYKGVHM